MGHLKIPETRAAARQMRNRRNATFMIIMVIISKTRMILTMKEVFKTDKFRKKK